MKHSSVEKLSKRITEMRLLEKIQKTTSRSDLFEKNWKMKKYLIANAECLVK